MKAQRLNLSQFQEAITAANRHFSLIRKKYPDLRGYLVISSQGNQINADAKLLEIIKSFPALLAPGPAKILMQAFLKAPRPEKPTDLEIRQWEEQFQKLASALEFIGEAQLEIRFHDLDYELIRKLQSDDLVDRVLTPQTGASIHIVLGTISHFQNGM